MQLLEREQFLASLAADLNLAAQGVGRTALVRGEAGIGKTSLLEAFARQSGSKHLLWGGCEALATPNPLGPLHDIARDSHERLRIKLGDGSDRAALFAALLDELSTVPLPTVLVIEDVHWADAATLDLITYLGRRIQRVPALMILSYRHDELSAEHPLRKTIGQLPPRHVSRYTLPSLSLEAITTLSVGHHRNGVEIHAVTGGNPFFVTELLAHVTDRVPATVRDAVLGRAATLMAAAREVLELASIVPRAIETAIIDAVLSPDLAAVEACLAVGLLLAEPQALRFRHELARVAVEESIAPPRARQLHAKVLAALSAPTAEPVALARLVHHAQLAEDNAALLRFAPQAAAEAVLRGARREAAAHCKLALTVSHLLPDAARAQLLEDYAKHCFELGDLSAAIPARAAAIDLFKKTGDVARQIESLALQAMPLVRALRNTEADQVSRSAIALAEQHSLRPQLARAYAIESYLRMLNRDYAEAVAYGERAIALASELHDPDVLAAAYNSVGAALMFVDFPRGCEHVRTSLQIARELGDGGMRAADAYVMLGTASGELYQFESAQSYLEEGIAFARAHDLDRLGGYMEAWRALLDMYRGNWDIAGERAAELVEREAVGSTNRLMALLALARLRTRRGDPGAQRILDEALALAEPTASLQRIAPVRCARAEAAWLRQDTVAVQREAAAGFALAAAKGHPWFLGELAYWRWRAGDLTQAPTGCAEPYALQIAGLWREAAAAWQLIGAPYEQARALAEGDEPAQRAALTLLDHLGARPLAELLRRQMRVAGVQAVPRGPRQSTVDNAAGLTARETQVLLLMAQDCPNAQIAQQLSRSTRTIEHHIAAIFAKLQVSSRTAAVAAARRRSMLPK